MWIDGQEKPRIRCSFHMVAEPRSEGALDAMPSSDGLVPESSLATEEEQELTEIDILKKQLDESKAEQENMNATIQDLVKMMDYFQEKEKHKGQAMHEADQGGAEGSMSKLEGFNKKDTYLRHVTGQLSELDGALHHVHDKHRRAVGRYPSKVAEGDTALSRNAIDDLQDNLKMTHAVKKSARHALYINLLGYTCGKAKRRVKANAVDMAFESYTHICSKGKNATKMNIVIMKGRGLATCARATRIEENLTGGKRSSDTLKMLEFAQRISIRKRLC